MKLREVNDEVFCAVGGIVQVNSGDVAFLAGKARGNVRRRARLCAHPGSQDRLHEMLIVLDRDTYIRPHRHAGKSESFHLIEGELDVVIFHDDGSIREVVRMGAYGSDRAFYYRLMEDCFHTVLIGSEYALFHETTNGPFNRNDTEFASWSPAEGDLSAPDYIAGVRAAVARTQSRAA